MLIEKMHEMYSEDIVTKDLLGCIEGVMSGLDDEMKDVDKNRLLNFTTWFLDEIECVLGISEKGGEHIQRCKGVKNKLLTRGRIDIDGVQNICESVTEDFYAVYDAMMSKLSVISQVSMAAVSESLREYVPAHILIEYLEYLRKHGELPPFRHGELARFTHKEIRERFELE